jgi:hypothetical protein
MVVTARRRQRQGSLRRWTAQERPRSARQRSSGSPAGGRHDNVCLLRGPGKDAQPLLTRLIGKGYLSRTSQHIGCGRTKGWNGCTRTNRMFLHPALAEPGYRLVL